MENKFIDNYIKYKDEIKERIKHFIKYPIKGNKPIDFEIDGYYCLMDCILQIFYEKIGNEYSLNTLYQSSYSGDVIIFFTYGDYGNTNYYYTYTYYGSCSGCDTIKSIFVSDNIDEKVNDLYVLGLHLIEKIKELKLEIGE